MPHHCEICEKHPNHLGCQTVCCRVPAAHAVIGWQGYGGKGGVRPSHSAAAQWQQAVAVCLHLFSTWSGNCPLSGETIFFFWKVGGRAIVLFTRCSCEQMWFVSTVCFHWFRRLDETLAVVELKGKLQPASKKQWLQNREISLWFFAHNAVCLFIRDAKYQAGLRWLRLNGGWMVTGFWSIGCTFF